MGFVLLCILYFDLSSVSFRNLPSPSLNSIKKICEYYESKCSGQYNSLASRYVLQMSQEIKNQVEGMQHCVNKPQHFTFHDCIANNFDKIYPQNDDDNLDEKAQGGIQPKNRNEIYNNSTIESEVQSKSEQNASIIALERQVKMLKECLLEKKTEIRVQKENAEQQCKEKNQVDRLHFENSQRLLKHKHHEELRKARKEIVQVKSDARLVIDFVRRKANEAIADESSKMEFQKKSMGKKMETMESQMRKTFHSHLHKLEEEVKMVVRKEKKAIDLTILPPPPPKHISIISKHKSKPPPIIRSCYNMSIPSDESEAPDLCSDDSISTCYSDMSRLASREEKDSNISDVHELLKSRVHELEQWTDTLTLALRKGAKIKGSDLTSNQKAMDKKILR